MEVKLLDLVPQYETMKDEILDSVNSVFSSQQFILGETVRRFERRMEDYYGVRHAVGTASGSDAILISLMALGVGSGDEVITTPYTFFSTVSSIVRLGASPVFVDIDPRTYNIEPNLIGEAVTENTRAIIAVHLFGQSAEMERIMNLAREKGISVIEDACQSIGARYMGTRCGKMGDAGCFSFFPSKNLGGAGDGGMIITGRDDIAEMARTLRVHGEVGRYRHNYLGINSRLDALQAAVLEVKLKYLEKWNRMRRENAFRYTAAFAEMNWINPPSILEHNTSTFNQYVIRAENRDRLRDYLKSNQIGTAIYYPVPLHMQPCFRSAGYREGSMPQSELAAKQTLALPVYPELTRDQQDYVIDTIKRFPSALTAPEVPDGRNA